MGFVLKEKFKVLKVKLREWNKEEYGKMDMRITTLMEGTEELDVGGESNPLNADEVRICKEKFNTLWTSLKAKDSLSFQRSRVKWLKEGDSNTRFFHNCMKARLKGNMVTALKVDDVWVQSPLDVRKVVVDYFSAQVVADGSVRPTLEGVPFDMLIEDEKLFLTLPFTGEEIEEVVKKSDGNKSLGPDELNFVFIKRIWYLMKNEVRIMFDQFHAKETILKGLLAYFVTLIPKVSSLMTLKDFRPISLLG